MEEESFEKKITFFSVLGAKNQEIFLNLLTLENNTVKLNRFDSSKIDFSFSNNIDLHFCYLPMTATGFTSKSYLKVF